MTKTLKSDITTEIVNWIHQNHITEFEDIVILGCDDHPEWTLVLDDDDWVLKQVVAAVELERKLDDAGIK